MKSNILKHLPILLIALTACQHVEQQPTLADKVVIEGYVFANHYVTLRATKQLAFNSTDSTIMPVEGLNIMLSDGVSSEILTYIGDGEYQSQEIIAKAGSTYSITFSYNDEYVYSETTIPQKPLGFNLSATTITVPSFGSGMGGPPQHQDPVQMSWDNTENRYYLVVVETTSANPSPIYDTTSFAPPRIFINNPVQTNYYQLNVMNFSYYGTHRVILFNINPEYAALYDNSGSSSLNLTAPPSNVEGGLGVFTGINADTAYVVVK